MGFGYTSAGLAGRAVSFTWWILKKNQQTLIGELVVDLEISVSEDYYMSGDRLTKIFDCASLE